MMPSVPAGLAFLLLLMPASVQAALNPLPSVEYTIPKDRARLVSPRTTLAVRYSDTSALEGLARADWFSVRGERSGVCSGTVRVADDRRTVIFVPSAPFTRGERVDVRVERPGAEPYAFGFTISEHGVVRDDGMNVKGDDPCAPVPTAARTPAASPDSLLNGVAVPSDFPYVRVERNTTPGDGLLFLNNWGGSPYLLILDNDGTPRFYRKMPAPARDFKVQPTGLLTYHVTALGTHFAMDSTYTVVDTFRCKHGYGTDEHELQILENGHVLMIALDWQRVDMSTIVAGGNPNANVLGNHVQELDTGGNVVFEWRSWDHFEITDATEVELKAQTIDYVHMNAIDVDEDGNILISSRHLSEITKINRATGQIIWRLGGKNNQFTFLNDPDRISYQHDIRCLPGERYTLFDNGNYHSPKYSRAVEYQIDSVARTAERVWQFRRTPDAYTWWMGNAQRLPGGNTLIGWADASLPKVVEVTPDGGIVYQLDFTSEAHCYRAFRFPWTGQARAPYLVAEPHNDRVTLLYNFFADRPVGKYYVYGGTSPHPATKIDSSTVPRINLTALENNRTYYFRVTAADSTGWESDFSNEEAVQVRFIAPGETMVLNGDFSAGGTGWTLQKHDGGAAVSAITTDGRCFVAIGKGGAQVWSVQLAQQSFDLAQGKRYIVSFDGSAMDPRTLDVRLEKAIEPYTNYSKRGLLQLQRATNRFAFSFQMLDPSDVNTRLVFNMGQSDIDVFLDNIDVREVVTTEAREGPTLPGEFAVRGPFPNPFNPSTTIRVELPEASDVRLTAVNLLGQRVADVILGPTAAGVHDVPFSPVSLSSGVYLASVEARSATTGAVRRAVVKLLYLK
jgi:hypothetical protein